MGRIQIVVTPANKELSSDPCSIDLSQATFCENGLDRKFLLNAIEPGDPREILYRLLPSDNFSPIVFTMNEGDSSDPSSHDDVFEFLREINKLNTMLGGSGIQIDSWTRVED